MKIRNESQRSEKTWRTRISAENSFGANLKNDSTLSVRLPAPTSSWSDGSEVNPGLEMLKELPVKMEQSIAEVEKQSKKIYKTESTSEKALNLKDILTKLM